jgi:hypothetical protein
MLALQNREAASTSAEEIRTMRRRDVLKGITAGALGMCLEPFKELWGQQPAQTVKTVYVIYKCHLDLGFTDTERGVVRTYFDRFLPGAIEVAETLRGSGGEERYVWTAAAWLVYEYLEQASPEQRKRMEQAIVAGDIAYHAIPFTWQAEMLDRSLLSASLRLSAALDRRFNKKTIAGKLTDVPGFTRGIIGPLAEAGIRFVDIGDNSGCVGPDVPFLDVTVPSASPSTTQTGQRRREVVEPRTCLFNWRDPEGVQIMVLFHPLGYGGTVMFPGTDFALSVRVSGDNSGPQTADQVKASYATLRALFPEAKIVPTDLSTVAAALEPLRARLPVLTQEMGDTWIYGVGADPGKVARYRELSRLRLEWLSKGRFKFGDATDLKLTATLILPTDHNWGLSTGQYLRHPEIYSPKELSQARATMPEFKKMDEEWVAKRAVVDEAVTTLPPALQEEAKKRLQTLAPAPPDTRGLKPLAPGAKVESARFILSLDPATGAIVGFEDRKTGRQWASPQHPLASFRYQTFTAADFLRFNSTYNRSTRMSNDFGKPGLEKYPVQSRTWQPALEAASVGQDSQGHRIVAELRMPQPDAALADLVTWPQRLTMEIRLPKAESAAHITFQCFDKLANRLPEAMWLSFSPDAPDTKGWLLEKMDRPVSPLDVVPNGSRHLHAVTKNVRYHDAKGSFTLETLDAPLAAPGQRALLDFNNNQPDMGEGVHVNLYNNLWGTAFPQWYGDDMRFRFVIRV